MPKFNVTYEIVTPESAKLGDTRSAAARLQRLATK